MTYKIGGLYDEVNGKFSKVLGNVAIVDCNFFHNQLFDALDRAFFIMQFLDHDKYEKYYPMYQEVKQAFTEKSITMC